MGSRHAYRWLVPKPERLVMPRFDRDIPNQLEGTLFQPVGKTVDCGAVGREGRFLSQLVAS